MLSHFKCVLAATTKYCFFGKLIPTWNLKAHISREILSTYVKDVLPDITDQDIDKINVNELQEHFAKNDMAQSIFPIEKGVYADVYIPVKQVTIDPEWFSGTGVAEKMLCELVEIDEIIEDRIIKAEILASWDVAEYHGLDKETADNTLLKLAPLSDTESIVMYLHGGAFVFGSPGAYRKMVGKISEDTHLRCISIDYRKAPKYPFPAQLHDALISLIYLVKSGFKPENIIIAGDSAGGHLSLTLLFMLRKINMHKIRGAIVLSPAINFTDLESKSVKENKRYDYLHPFSVYVPTSPQRLLYKPGTKCTPEYLEEITNPLVSPVYGDFSDFPNTLIQAGEKEILRDQSRVLYEKIKADTPDKTVVFEEIENAIHVPHFTAAFPGAEEGFAGIKKFVESI